MMKRLFFLILVILCLPSAVSADRYARYELDLQYIPKWGEGDFIDGQIYAISEPCYEEDLFVKLFLRLEGSDTWWPKPTFETPYAPVVGSHFRILFNTGGDDIHAVQLALMLVHGKDAALTDYDSANAAALCVTTIMRTPNGEIKLAHSYRSESAWVPDIGMNVGFYTQERTAPGSELTESHIISVLKAAAAYTYDVRFYAATGEVSKAYPIARDLKLRTAATAWLDGSANDQAELDALIELCNSGLASTAIVGNETQHNKLLPLKTLLEDITYVRAGITDPEIPVTTSDTPDVILGNTDLRDACDILAVNIYPYWNGLNIEDAEADLHATLDALTEFADGKPFIVSETGWPSDGGDRTGDAEQTAAVGLAYDIEWQYYRENLEKVYWFSLADEPWKESTEGAPGAHWGILDSDLNAKPVIYERYWNWSAQNDFTTEKP
ncbi:MAG: hypothetical protein IJI41_05520 [Anaerolineaceae bacterium]|nr:hypothetical protein [Anaerolineaceae bacterium]